MQARRTQQGGGLQRQERWARSRKILSGIEKKALRLRRAAPKGAQTAQPRSVSI